MFATLSNTTKIEKTARINIILYISIFIAGLIGPLGFAPFHLPGFTLLSLAFFYAKIVRASAKESLILGFVYGLGYFGLGISWIIISIHDYGHIYYVFAGALTLIFVMYLSLFPALVAYLFKLLKTEQNTLLAIGSFSTLWCLSEFIRSGFITGFPWLLIGTSLIDTPMKYLAPIIGINGLSLICALLAALLYYSLNERSTKRYYCSVLLVLMLLCPLVIKNHQWTSISKEPISVGGIQANLSMRDKWDEHLFWQLLDFYSQSIDKLLGTQLIILPESAIPLPSHYLEEYIEKLNQKALAANSAIMIGIIQSTSDESESTFYNTILTLGPATGEHIKYQLVPFGEYIPKPFLAANRWLNLPEPTVIPGKYNQPLMKIAGHPIANLICYEIAYPNLLRRQMPQAQWIVSISDNGWFGHSLAGFQQLQMSQMLSLLTGRYQIVVNNDGLSSIINPQGDITSGLPAFSSGILTGQLFPAEGVTPWINFGDYPILIICTLFLILILFLRLRRFSEQ